MTNRTRDDTSRNKKKCICYTIFLKYLSNHTEIDRQKPFLKGEVGVTLKFNGNPSNYECT